MSDSEKEIYLSTGDVELDKLLAADMPRGGLLAGRSGRDGRTLEETSVVLIKGGAGVGKTTLALQIASAIATGKPDYGAAWAVLFVSLEQTADSLLKSVKNFAFGSQEHAETFLDLAVGPPKYLAGNRVYLTRLSPLPISDLQSEDTFETRFAELEHIVDKGSRSGRQPFLFCVIDSLNAFTGSPLNRSQLYQLFTLFRGKRIPLVATLEQPDQSFGSSLNSETASFLADIVIELSRDTKHDYLQFFIEISKSRVCRQGLGKHLYKTRTAENAKEVGAPNRTGIVVYPSVHFIVSQARREKTDTPSVGFSIAPELAPLLLQKTIRRPACFALHGPPGTHKLALGLNLGVSYVRNQAKLLVVTFGGQGEIHFPGVAWVGSRAYLRGLRRSKNLSPLDRVGTKAQIVTFSASHRGRRTVLAQLTFQIGVLTPEECLHRIRHVLEEATPPFQSVLLCDTAELCTGFPLLRRDPMFFAALLDLFETKGLLTVGIGVQAAGDPWLREINMALMAKASHRIGLWHFPEVESLMKRMVERASRPSGGTACRRLLTEQLVSAVIDNVTGKHYKRQPKWIWVEERKGKEHKTKPPKVLHCEEFSKPYIEWS